MTAPAKLLTAQFQGYFMCRLAVDPDPTNETRGRSGYTMALPSEAPLDQVIRLQPDQYVRDNTRRPADDIGVKVGVDVTRVTFDGRPWKGSRNLLGAHVSLEGKRAPFRGPVFVSRNNVIGSDDTMQFVIDPFTLTLSKPGFEIRATDYVDPSKTRRMLWQIDDPAVYARRMPVSFDAASLEVAQAISVFDGYAYFRGRRAFLQDEIDGLHASRKGAKAELAIEEAKSRLYQLEFWGDRMINKLGFRLEWEFDINGPQTVTGDLGGRAATEEPWHVRFWFGGWDGDLLIGYMRGELSIPFEPARS